MLEESFRPLYLHRVKTLVTGNQLDDFLLPMRCFFTVARLGIGHAQGFQVGQGWAGIKYTLRKIQRLFAITQRCLRNTGKKTGIGMSNLPILWQHAMCLLEYAGSVAISTVFIQQCCQLEPATWQLWHKLGDLFKLQE